MLETRGNPSRHEQIEWSPYIKASDVRYRAPRLVLSELNSPYVQGNPPQSSIATACKIDAAESDSAPSPASIRGSLGKNANKVVGKGIF